MSFTKPVVIDNQQVIALDFNDLADLPEELLRRYIQNFVVQGETDTYGWVLHGLGVTDSSAGETVSVQVEAGACVLPPSAGNDGYRLLIVPANINVTLTVPDAGTRTDVIQIVLQETPTDNDARFVRSLGPGGEPQAEQQNLNTRLRVTGQAAVNEGGGAVASPGSVRLASVAMDDTEITGITDRRTYVLPNSGTITTSLGNYTTANWRSLKLFSTFMTNALSLLTTRANVNLTSAGKLKTSLTADAGPNLTLDADELDIGARDLALTGDLNIEGSVNVTGALGEVTASGPGSFARVVVADSDVPATFAATGVSVTPGLTVNGGSMVRAIVHVQVTKTWDGVDSFDYTSAACAYHGVISVTRTGVGAYMIVFSVGGEHFGEPGGLDYREGHYSVEAFASPFTILVGSNEAGRDAERALPHYVHAYFVEADSDKTIRVATSKFFSASDTSFTVIVRGPIVMDPDNPADLDNAV